MKELWVEKYRPNKIDDYVFRDEAQKNQVKNWVKEGAIPHLLFSGRPGVGKTTLAKVLLHELDVDWGDVLIVNASSDNGVDYIRDKITSFASIMSFGEFKYVLLDEADYLSPNAQAILRGLMESYSNSCRFILTCNYREKIIPAIQSRSQGFSIETLDKTEFTLRVATVLVEENVEFDEDRLDTYVEASYPDMRKCIGMCQMNSQSGQLEYPKREEISEDDYKIEMVTLMKSGKFKEAREVICKNAQVDEYPGIFRFMYDNADIWGDTEQKKMNAIIIIRDGLVNHVSVADPEINLSATLCELETLTKD